PRTGAHAGRARPADRRAVARSPRSRNGARRHPRHLPAQRARTGHGQVHRSGQLRRGADLRPFRPARSEPVRFRPAGRGRRDPRRRAAGPELDVVHGLPPRSRRPGERVHAHRRRRWSRVGTPTVRPRCGSARRPARHNSDVVPRRSRWLHGGRGGHARRSGSLRLRAPRGAPTEPRVIRPILREVTMTEPHSGRPPVVDLATWQAARDELLVREKAHTKEGDAIAAARRRLPMVEFDGTVEVVGPDGSVPFLDLFQGRNELMVYKHMWYDGAPPQGQCEGCTTTAWHVRDAVYLNARGVS